VGSKADHARLVQLRWTPEFEAERRVFALRFGCEHCGHYDAERDRCRNEWPNELHRRPLPPVIDFCKEFELC
jgi:hypothetical protein